jgi:hypothetical protein
VVVVLVVDLVVLAMGIVAVAYVADCDTTYHAAYISFKLVNLRLERRP